MNVALDTTMHLLPFLIRLHCAFELQRKRLCSATAAPV